jgi:hypothetical protein
MGSRSFFHVLHAARSEAHHLVGVLCKNRARITCSGVDALHYGATTFPLIDATIYM